MNKNFSIGEKIKILRKSMGLTQEQLAEKANIDYKYLSKIENGLHHPTYKTIQKLSEALNNGLDIINNVDNIPQNTILQKSLKILNSAKDEQERKYYYDVLKLAQKGLNYKFEKV